MNNKIRSFTPPGPISQSFVDDWRHSIIGLNGPVGSGKTTTVFTKCLKLAYMMPPSKLDGVARIRIGVIRDTYPNMASTIQTWHEMIPKDIGEYTGSWPAEHRLRLKMRRNGKEYPLEIHTIFRAIGSYASAEEALKGAEFTVAVVNERDLCPDDTLSYLDGRVGRFPSKDHGDIPWFGVLCDFNAPNETAKAYEEFYSDIPKGWAFYRLPGGMDEGAENLHNLRGGREFYERQVENPDKVYVSRMVHNLPGFSRDGKPVFPEFNYRLHVSEKVEILPDRPLYLGLDQGNHPAILFMQDTEEGQVRILDEIAGGVILPSACGDAINQKLSTRFYGLPVQKATGDPASFAKNNDTTWAQIISNKTGLTITPAPTNAIASRLDCVRGKLVTMVSGGEAAVIIDKRYCQKIISALGGGYHYKKVGGNVMDVPNKNDASNVADAMQYGFMGIVGYGGVVGKKSNRDRSKIYRLKVKVGS